MISVYDGHGLVLTLRETFLRIARRIVLLRCWRYCRQADSVTAHYKWRIERTYGLQSY